jgi:prophage regulatory protein
MSITTNPINPQQQLKVNDLKPSVIIKLRDVIEITKKSRSSIYAAIDKTHRSYDPTFPRPIKLGVRSIGWESAGIFSWIESRRGS